MSEVEEEYQFTSINCECISWAWYPELGAWSFKEHHPLCKHNTSKNNNLKNLGEVIPKNPSDTVENFQPTAYDKPE